LHSGRGGGCADKTGSMLRALIRMIVLACVVLASGWWYFFHSNSPAAKIERLEEEKKQLEKIVTRLTTDRRVAEFIVTGQQQVNGELRTTILWEETNPQGARVGNKSFTIKGDEVHIDALSIRFQEDFVLKDDPLRGKGLILFTKLYGAHQTPAEGYAIDEPGQTPGIYKKDQPGSVLAGAGAGTSGDPESSKFERGLWQDFWRLVHDKKFREEKGVKVASGKGVWIRRVDQGKVYTVTVDAHGNPTVDWEAIKPILREALRSGTSDIRD
jgi:hypothetical protein